MALFSLSWLDTDGYRGDEVSSGFVSTRSVSVCAVSSYVVHFSLRSACDTSIRDIQHKET